MCSFYNNLLTFVLFCISIYINRTNRFWMDKKKLAQLLMVPLTILLVWLLMTQASLQDVVTALSSVGPWYLMASFLLYVLLYIVRALRFSVMLNTRDFGGMFSIVCTHSMANNTMPFRTGELAFVYLAKMRMDLPMSIGMAVIAIARLYDVLAICILFIASLMIAHSGFGYFSGFVPEVAILTLLLALLIIAIIWFNRYFAALTDRALSHGILHKARFLQSKIEKVCAYCSSLKPHRSMAILLALSLAMWVIQALNLYMLSSNMGLGLDYGTAFVGMLLSIIFVSLPIQGVGNFGSFELAWSAIFVALGTPLAAAISSGFAVHLVLLTFATILWIYGMVSDRLKFHKIQKVQEHT